MLSLRRENKQGQRERDPVHSPSLGEQLCPHQTHAGSREPTFQMTVGQDPEVLTQGESYLLFPQNTPGTSTCYIPLCLAPSTTAKCVWRSYLGKTLPLKGTEYTLSARWKAQSSWIEFLYTCKRVAQGSKSKTATNQWFSSDMLGKGQSIPTLSRLFLCVYLLDLLTLSTPVTGIFSLGLHCLICITEIYLSDGMTESINRM